jgi:hypothetical protein
MKSSRDINPRRTLISIINNKKFYKNTFFLPSTTAQYKQYLILFLPVQSMLFFLIPVVLSSSRSPWSLIPPSIQFSIFGGLNRCLLLAIRGRQEWLASVIDWMMPGYCRLDCACFRRPVAIAHLIVARTTSSLGVYLCSSDAAFSPRWRERLLRCPTPPKMERLYSFFCTSV